MFAGNASDELRFRSGLRSMEFLCSVCALTLKSWLPEFRQLSVCRVSATLNISTAPAPVEPSRVWWNWWNLSEFHQFHQPLRFHQKTVFGSDVVRFFGVGGTGGTGETGETVFLSVVCNERHPHAGVRLRLCIVCIDLTRVHCTMY